MLFGHQNDVNQPQQSVPDQSVQAFAPTPDPATGVNPLAVDPATGASLPTVPPNSTGAVDTPDEPSVLDQPASPLSAAPDAVVAPTYAASAPAVGADTTLPDPGTPFSASPAPAPAVDTLSATQETQEAATLASSLDTPGTENNTVLTPDAAVAADPQPSSSSVFTNAPDDVSSAPAPVAGDLLGLKQQAITQLSPLVGHLDQGPEEKFRTTMMLIQSTDNPSLLQDAYNTAQSITDDKTRAQALLDIVNEINYFTQQQGA